MENDSILIGELAQRAGVHRETLRYYERRGLLTSRRTASGYRVYRPEAQERLSFIRRAQTFGFTLDEISVLLGLRPDSPRSCRRVLEILDQKVEELARQITEMKRFHRQMSGYRDQCARAIDKGSRCPVIADVSHERA
ncbi:MAG: heavy metal-responsive transcriptional regulator [Vicinamibacteria bacterium]